MAQQEQSGGAADCFWGDKRYETLRTGLRALLGEMGRGPQWFYQQMRGMHRATDVPSEKTLARLVSTEGTPLRRRNSSHHLTAVLRTCERIYTRSGTKESALASGGLSAELEALLALARQYDEDEEAPAPKATDSTLVEMPRSVLASIASHIYVPTDNDPNNPEFPPHCPHFPVHMKQIIQVDGRPVVIKDESRNPSGTHKDRWAWEMIADYKKHIYESLAKTSRKTAFIQRYSMISTGSAAFALQSMLRLRMLPDLNVLMDGNRRHEKMENRLRSVGANLQFENLQNDFLNSKEVLRRTNNKDGKDVTPREPDVRYYDWLAYEILNERPHHIFVPFGTGGLFSSIIEIIHGEVALERRDQRLYRSNHDLKSINVYGATCDEPGTEMDHLFAKHRPAIQAIRTALASYIANRHIGSKSCIDTIDDDQARDAMSELTGAKPKIRTNLSGSAGLALYKAKAASIPAGETVLVVNTGCVHMPPQ